MSSLKASGLVLLAGLLLIGALWLSYGAITSLYLYMSHVEQTVPIEISWKVLASNEEHYRLQARYRYQVQGEVYPGVALLEATVLKNPWAAQEAQRRAEQQVWTVWYEPAQPAQSRLERIFPIKGIVYSAIAWLLVLYFALLALYVRRYGL